MKKKGKNPAVLTERVWEEEGNQTERGEKEYDDDKHHEKLSDDVEPMPVDNPENVLSGTLSLEVIATEIIGSHRTNEFCGTKLSKGMEKKSAAFEMMSIPVTMRKKMVIPNARRRLSE